MEIQQCQKSYCLIDSFFPTIKDFTDLGFDDVKTNYKNAHTRKSIITGLRRRRKIGDMPPVYPNGWFIIMETDNLPKKAAKQINVLGK